MGASGLIDCRKSLGWLAANGWIRFGRFASVLNH
jgi:hypothetical protein